MSRNGTAAKREEWAFAGSLAEQVLAHAQSGCEAVQQSVPLAESLEWTLGQEYLRQRGNRAFLSDALPLFGVTDQAGDVPRDAALLGTTGRLVHVNPG